MEFYNNQIRVVQCIFTFSESVASESQIRINLFFKEKCQYPLGVRQFSTRVWLKPEMGLSQCCETLVGGTFYSLIELQ